MATRTKMVFNLGDKMVKFTVEDFKDEVDLDQLLKIDYGNLMAELITFPVILNKLGILNAQMENQLREAKLNFKIREAKLSKQVRAELSTEKAKPTINEVSDALQSNKIYQKYQREYFEAELHKDYITSIYLSAREKGSKLEKLSLTLKSGDFDEAIIQKQLNNVYYRIKDKK